MHHFVRSTELDNFCWELLLQQCRTFVRHASGAASASAGAHDDCVMAMAIALAVREQSHQSQNGQESRWASFEMGMVQK